MLTAGGTGDAERTAEVPGLASLHQLRQVLLAQPLAKLPIEVLTLDLQSPLDGSIRPRADGVAKLVEEVQQTVLAPALLDVVEGSVAEAVGKKSADVGLGNGGDQIVDHRIPQVHAILGRLVLRHVAGQPFHQP